MDKYISYINPKQNMRGFVIGILILAALGMGIGAVMVTNPPETSNIADEIAAERFSSPNVFVYAYWAGDRSEIKSFDLSTGEDLVLATLPLNVKHAKLLSPNELIYINETDGSDYGSQIVVKTISSGQDRIVVQANPDVRIDDYRVSPNGQFVATWEVALPVESTQLFNGISRVYVTDINSGVKNQIYSEVANVPVNYPVAVLDDGRVFTDKFLPNDTVGWSYGMTVADFSGNNKQDIDAMQNGTYGSQPVLSPDGTMLVFTGYDGSKGGGADLVQDMRRAIISSNTVDTLDVNTLTRSRLSNLSTDNFYATALWDDISGNVIFSQSSKNPEETGTYSYQLGTNNFEKIDLQSLDPISSSPKKTIASLGSGINLVGQVTTTESTMGNLGNHYGQVLDAVYVVTDDDTISLDITNGFVQVIAVKPTAYFGGMQSLATADSTDSGGIKGNEPEQLQLQTFTIKPTLEPMRVEQQSGDRCRDVVAASCNALLGTEYTADEAARARGNNFISDKAFESCVKEQWSAARTAGCSNSPLYLYGDKGMDVTVKVGTPVSNSKAPYTPVGGYVGNLTGEGGIIIGGKTFSSLEFDYDLATHYKIPTKGFVINRDEFDSKLTEYGKNLGMNQKELNDFVKHIKSETKSEKIFISHFSNEISKKLLPLYFYPEPDSYSNIVFYINDSGNMLNYNPALPEFEKIQRNGFTAVEISYILVK